MSAPTIEVESEEACAKQQEDISQMQDEVIALYKAWVDRGIPHLSAAAGIASAGNLIMARLGMPFIDAIEMMLIQRRAVEANQ